MLSHFIVISIRAGFPFLVSTATPSNFKFASIVFCLPIVLVSLRLAAVPFFYVLTICCFNGFSLFRWLSQFVLLNVLIVFFLWLYYSKANAA